MKNQFSLTKKSVCTWLTEQPLSQWMMATIIKKIFLNKNDLHARRGGWGKKTDFFPQLMFNTFPAWRAIPNRGTKLSFFHYRRIQMNFCLCCVCQAKNSIASSLETLDLKLSNTTRIICSTLSIAILLWSCVNLTFFSLHF